MDTSATRPPLFYHGGGVFILGDFGSRVPLAAVEIAVMPSLIVQSRIKLLLLAVASCARQCLRDLFWLLMDLGAEGCARHAHTGSKERDRLAPGLLILGCSRSRLLSRFQSAIAARVELDRLAPRLLILRSSPTLAAIATWHDHSFDPATHHALQPKRSCAALALAFGIPCVVMVSPEPSRHLHWLRRRRSSVTFDRRVPLMTVTMVLAGMPLLLLVACD